MHYALHHTKLPAYIREQKKYHLAHHYKNFELGFGVTSMPFICLSRQKHTERAGQVKYGT